MHVLILGTRGIPASHGGFETFAQDFALHLVRAGHTVTVYCQSDQNAAPLLDDCWNGIRLVHIRAPQGPWGTIAFDWAATLHSSKESGVILTLGYNTAIFSLLYRLRSLPSVMNMDGIEWKREKWRGWQRLWLRANEWAGARLANHLIADHPHISLHLQAHTSASKITVIPYGADAILSAPEEPLRELGLRSKQYYLLIARPEPENSILEIVRAFSHDENLAQLVILGDYTQGTLQPGYQREVLHAAGPGVRFLGAIYDKHVLGSLRFHARAYVHGHRVGGTNPSLVEALAAGNAILAHDNRFNRWVAGSDARYFQSSDDLITILRSIEQCPTQLKAMEEASRLRHAQEFTQHKVLGTYESLLLQVAQMAGSESAPARNPKPR